ncbi:MAG: NHL repeat-containing protein [Bacteroidota bacterium]
MLLALTVAATAPPDPLHAQVQTIRGTRCDADLYGNFFIVDAARNALRSYSPTGKLQREVGGTGWGNDQFDRPSSVWARNGIDVFVADYGNHRIQRFDRSLTFISSLSTRDSDNPDVRFGYPTDVSLSRLGELFVCDSENGRIIVVDRSNHVERTFGGFGGGKGRLMTPTQIEIGPHDAVYVLDGRRIAVFDAFGNYQRDLAPGLFASPAALFADPERIVVLDGDTLYDFNADERPTGATLISRAAPGAKTVTSLAHCCSTLWLLSDEGLCALPDSSAGPIKP